MPTSSFDPSADDIITYNWPNSCINHSFLEKNRPPRLELEDFEDDSFHPESYVFERIHFMEEEEEVARHNFQSRLCGITIPAYIFGAKSKEDYASKTKAELRRFIVDLKQFQQVSAKQVIKSLITHHATFLRMSREVASMEQGIIKLRSLLRTRTGVVRNLAEWIDPIRTLPNSAAKTNMYSKEIINPSSSSSSRSNPEYIAFSLPNIFDSLLAERKIELALATLEEGENLVRDCDACTSKDGNLSLLTPVTSVFLQAALKKRKNALLDYLAYMSKQPSVRGVELRAIVAYMDQLGEGAHAHTMLLYAHYARFKRNSRGLHPIGTSYRGALTAALSQMAFSTILQAARDSRMVFGDVPEFASEIVVWACKVTEFYARLIKQHVLSSAAATGALRGAAECVEIAFGYCSLLESHGLILCPMLAKKFRPSVEQAMEANMKRIEESVAAMASADDWVLTFYQSTPSLRLRSLSTSSRTLIHRSQSSRTVKLSSSAHQFISMVQDLMEGVYPLISLHLAGFVLEGLCLLFNDYIAMLIKAVPGLARDGKEYTTNTETRQLALINNATTLAYELLPPLAPKVLPKDKESWSMGLIRQSSFSVASNTLNYNPNKSEWQQKLRTAVKRLQYSICKHSLQYLLDPAYKVKFVPTPATYIDLDSEGSQNPGSNKNGMPSDIFQALFHRLIRIQRAGEEASISKETVVIPFMSHLLEVFASWLDETEFWRGIEDGPQLLGPIGLQQFVLDMQFVAQMASSNNCNSPILSSLIQGLTSRAVNAFAATGADPERVLPSDDWFLEAASIAFQKLSTMGEATVDSPNQGLLPS